MSARESVVEWPDDVVGADPFYRREHFSLEIRWRGFCAAVVRVVSVCDVPGVPGYRVCDSCERVATLLRSVFRIRDLLETCKALSAECLPRRSGALVG